MKNKMPAFASIEEKDKEKTRLNDYEGVWNKHQVPC